MSKRDIEALLHELSTTLTLDEQLDIIIELLQNVKRDYTNEEGKRKNVKTGLCKRIVDEACTKFLELRLYEMNADEVSEKMHLIVETFQWLMEHTGHN